MTSERQETPDFDRAEEQANALLDPADTDAGYDGKATLNLARAYLALRATPRAVPDEALAQRVEGQ